MDNTTEEGEYPQVAVRLIANNTQSTHHNNPCNRFASVIGAFNAGEVKLAEVYNKKTKSVEYAMCASWRDPEGKEHLFPFGKLFIRDDQDGLYAFPDGNGGWFGIKEPNDSKKPERTKAKKTPSNNNGQAARGLEAVT